MSDKITFSMIGLIVGLAASLIMNRKAHIDQQELQDALVKAASSIQVSSPAVNMTVQKLDASQLERLRIRGDFVWQPVFNADNLILQGHRGTATDTSTMSTS